MQHIIQQKQCFNNNTSPLLTSTELSFSQSYLSLSSVSFSISIVLVASLEECPRVQHLNSLLLLSISSEISHLLQLLISLTHNPLYLLIIYSYLRRDKQPLHRKHITIDNPKQTGISSSVFVQTSQPVNIDNDCCFQEHFILTTSGQYICPPVQLDRSSMHSSYFFPFLDKILIPLILCHLSTTLHGVGTQTFQNCLLNPLVIQLEWPCIYMVAIIHICYEQ